jgi:hypothetical protein
MIQQAIQATPTEVERSQAVHPVERDEREAMPKVEPILIDAALQVGALVDAVCCRCGDWVDRRHYRSHPEIRTDNRTAATSIIRLALAENDRGLRAGGYIDICVLPREGVVEANGGYYDPYHQPKPVIEGSLRRQDVSYQAVGQLLIQMFERIVRAYMACETSDDSRGDPRALWTACPAPTACAAKHRLPTPMAL